MDDNNLESIGSNEVNTTVIDSIYPSSPKNLTYQEQGRLIILNWSKSNALDLHFYYIFRASQPILNTSNLNPLGNTSLSSWIESDLLLGSYYYCIVAVDINGLRSNISNTVLINIVEPNSNTLLFIIIGGFAIIGAVTGYAVNDRRRNPNSKFLRFNRQNFKNSFMRFERKLTSFSGIVSESTTKTLTDLKVHLVHAMTNFKTHLTRLRKKRKNQAFAHGKQEEKKPIPNRKDISPVPLKAISELKPQIPSKLQVASRAQINKALKVNLQLILKVFHTKEEVTLEEIEAQTALSELEVQQCLAFLNDHQLIIYTTVKPSSTIKYLLCEDFNQRWSQLED